MAFHTFRNVNNTSYFDIVRVITEIKRQMSEGRYRPGRDTIHDFTISQEWEIGSVFGTPHYSKICTLGLHKFIERPILQKSKVISAKMMYVSLTYDNSLINDKHAVEFLSLFKLCIEEPRYILVNKE